MISIKNIKKHLWPAVITLFFTSAAVFLWMRDVPFVTYFLDTIELKTIDLRFQYRGEQKKGSDVVLAVIDEKSLQKEGKWPWPRKKIANFIDIVSDSGAKVIVFDIGFFEKDDTRSLKILYEIETWLKNKKINTDYIEALKSENDQDLILKNSIKNSSAKIILGYYFQLHDNDKIFSLNQSEKNSAADLISTSQYTKIHHLSKKALNVPITTAVIPESNIDIISNASEKSGFFNMIPDSDGVVRWMPVVIKFNEMLYSPISIMAVNAWYDSDLSVEISKYGVENIQTGPRIIPTNKYGEILINYRGGAKTFPYISMTDILNGKTSPKELKNKIVIAGATAAGIFDMRATPFSNVFPGSEIHANIIDSIISNDLLYHPLHHKIWSIIAVIIAGLSMGYILSHSGAVTGIISFISMTSLYWALCQALFSKTGLVLNFTYPFTTLVAVYTCVTAFLYLSETRKKKFINDAFSTYLAPSVVKQLIESPELLELGGEEREITAFFSDIQGFTTISEKLNPKELVDLLNEFLTEMTNIILNHEGTVDKFEGDAIIAFFGAPGNLENHAEVACKATIEMHKKLKELNKKWQSEGKPELKMRVGLCSGKAVVGNMGSVNRMDYTMMGDTVNTAARLEGINKVYGSYTMISESTQQKAGHDILTRFIDTIYLVGKKEPVSIFEITGPKLSINDSVLKTCRYYEAGMISYRKQNWKEALNYFRKGLRLMPEDGPSRTMAQRCIIYMENPPGKDWDGVYTATSK